MKKRARWVLLKIGMLALTVMLLKLTGLCFCEQSAYATHFRYGHVSWKPGDVANEIEFTVDGAFRRNGYFGSGADGFPIVNDVITETIGGTSLGFGDGAFTTTLQYKVTSYDETNNWLFGRALDPNDSSKTTISHTYSLVGTYTAMIDSCCRISDVDGVNEHINNPDGSYRVETMVTVGTGNSSPVSAMPPIVQCAQNGLCTFTVPGSEADGGTLNFRLSTSTEASGFAGFTQPGPPDATNAATVNSSTGVYSWDTTGATLAGDSSHNTLYSTQVTIEELDGAGSVKDKSAVDFLIQLVPSVSTNNSPDFDHPPTPTCGTTKTGNIGTTMTFNVQASDPDSGDTVQLNVAGLPPSATMNPGLPLSGNPVNSEFSWTPTTGEAGIYVMTFTATDSHGAQALCSITVQVFVENCTNGVDDDGDGLIDCDDPDCTLDSSCATAVGLVSFSANANNDSTVSLTWETASEIDNAGFNLYRSRFENGPYTQINNSVIPAQGSATNGASYSFTDKPGRGAFYYKLEDVNDVGVSTMHDPVKVKVGLKNSKKRGHR